ncbi:MAG: hypothetical protein RLZ98_2146 [Pseudomonadota bacterium]|jgi:tripartite-type tricarboxylate transporter receptor subunit TctC
MAQDKPRMLAFAGAAVALAAFPLGTAAAQTVEQFYKGKQLKFIIHSKAGGGYDMWVRLFGPYIAKYLPGEPTFVPNNMPGGGGILAANYMYNNAPKDGSVVGVISRNLPYQALTKVKNIRFDPVKYSWIGSPERTNRICAVTDNSPVKTAQEAFQKQALFGGAGAGGAVSTVPVLLNNLLGTKFKLVEGYGASIEVQLAMQRGEVHGLCASHNTIEAGQPGAIASGKLLVLFNMERKPVPELKAPSIHQFAKTDEQRRILTLFSSSIEFGRPFLAPPDIPKDRLGALRASLAKSVEDPKLLADAKSQNLEIALTTGDELASLVNDMMSTPPALVKKMEALTK